MHFLGSVGLLGCVVIASLAGVSTLRTLAGGGLAVVAWDAGRYALDLSTDVSVAAETWRVEALHLLAVGSGTAFVLGFEYVLLRGVAGGRSLLGLSALLVGVLALLLALQRRAYGDGVDGRSA